MTSSLRGDVDFKLCLSLLTFNDSCFYSVITIGDCDLDLEDIFDLDLCS